MRPCNLAVSVMLAAGMAACDRTAPATQPAAAPSAEVAGVNAEPARGGIGIVPAMEQTRRCENPAAGYSVDYPDRWQVNTGSTMDACSLFDPGPIDVPENSEIPPSIAVMIDVEPVAFAAVTGEVLGRHEKVRESTLVAGRPRW